MTNPYLVLGAHAKMTDDEIRALYRAAARQQHPDRGGSAEQFAAITAAYAATATATARAKLRRLHALRCAPCATCDGSGATSQRRGYTHIGWARCAACGGCGYIEHDATAQARRYSGVVCQ